MTRTHYDDLALVPSIVADTVLNTRYTGREVSVQVRSSYQVEAVEAARVAMTAEDRRDFVLFCDRRCRAAYDAGAEWFRKCLSNPAQLHAWVSHWLCAWLVGGLRERTLQPPLTIGPMQKTAERFPGDKLVYEYAPLIHKVHGEVGRVHNNGYLGQWAFSLAKFRRPYILSPLGESRHLYDGAAWDTPEQAAAQALGQIQQFEAQLAAAK